MAKRDEKGAVERLKNRLYDRGSVGKEVKTERAGLSPGESDVPRTWKEAEEPAPQETPAAPVPPPAPLPPLSQAAADAVIVSDTPEPKPPKQPMSFATKFFLGSIIFFVGAVGVSAALFFGGVNTTSPQNIDVEIIAPSLSDSGKQADLEVIITNRNTTTLELADLVVDYPDGTRSPNDLTRPLTHERISIGSINSGQQIKRTISGVFYGGEGSVQTIAARLEYSVAGSNSVFEKQGQTSFTIGSAPVSLTIDAPQKITAGTPFGVTITVRSNASVKSDDVAVEAQLPFGFSLSGSEPAIQGSMWRLGTLKPGDTKVIKLNGSIDASDGDERVFRFLVGANTDPTDAHVKVPFIVVPQTLTVERSFVTASLALDSKTGATVSVPAGKTLNGTVTWENNLPEAISNLELVLSVTGPAIDKNTIQSPNGFYQSSSNSILWTSEGEGSLASVAPGSKSNFQFSFATLPPGANGTLITNPTATLSLSIRGTRQEGGAENIATAAVMKVVLASALSAAAQVSRSTGPYQNYGPLPPRAEQETSYTVTWTVKNSANTVANAVAQAVLPPYVKFIKGDSGVTYDQNARTVKWSLGDITAGAGYTRPMRTASFQVAITPSTSQVGTTPQLMGVMTVLGQDRFAQVSVDASAEPVTTVASDSGGMDSVSPKQ
jgi:hypothetical protein